MIDETPKFPHLENLHRAPFVLNAPRVWITEKIDGFNARFGRKPDGTFWAGTRNQVLKDGDDPQGFGSWVRTIEDSSIVHMIFPGETFYGEWAGKGVQKRIDYGEPAFWLFAIRRADGDWATPEDVKRAAFDFGFKIAPSLYDGAPLPVEMLDEMRSAESVAAPGAIREGIVIWPYPMQYDEHGHSLIAKFKSEAFAERASQKTPRVPVDLTNLTAFVADYVTEERLRHVLARVVEENDLRDIDDPLDAIYTGHVLRTMYEDVVREGRADFEALSEEDQRVVGRVVARATKPLLDAARVASIAA